MALSFTINLTDAQEQALNVVTRVYNQHAASMGQPTMTPAQLFQSRSTEYLNQLLEKHRQIAESNVQKSDAYKLLVTNELNKPLPLR